MSAAGALSGRTVLVARAAGQGLAWRAALEALGARVVEVPALAIAPPADPGPLRAAAAGLAAFGWVALTSPNGVAALQQALRGRPWPAGTRLAVVGPATAGAAAAFDWPVALTASQADGAGLGAAMAAAGPLTGQAVLLARGDLAASDLPDALRAAGADVREVEAYRTVPDPALRAALAAALEDPAPPCWLALGSGSAVRHVLAAWPSGADLTAVRIATIGPRTSEAVRAAGLAVAAEAEAPTAASLAVAIALADH